MSAMLLGTLCFYHKTLGVEDYFFNLIDYEPLLEIILTEVSVFRAAE